MHTQASEECSKFKPTHLRNYTVLPLAGRGEKGERIWEQERWMCGRKQKRVVVCAVTVNADVNVDSSHC